MTPAMPSHFVGLSRSWLDLPSWATTKNLEISRVCKEICGVLQVKQVCGGEGKGVQRMGSGVPTVSKNDGVGVCEEAFREHRRFSKRQLVDK